MGILGGTAVKRIASFLAGILCVALLAATSFAEPKAPTSGPASGPATKPAAVLDLGGGIELKLALIPSGTFIMGSESGHAGRPHEVTISKPFYMGIYMVTYEQCEQIMGRAKFEKFMLGGLRGGYEFAYKNDHQHAAARVNWFEADELCRKLSQLTGSTVRLPTEAEWEYACRAGTTTAYFFGNDDRKLGEYAFGSDTNDSMYHPVGQKKPNPWGLYDMYGLLNQWCSDWWYGAYPRGPVTDPTGPTSGEYRVTRGGDGADSTYRGNYDPSRRYDRFRVVVEAPLAIPEKSTKVGKFLSIGETKHHDLNASSAWVGPMPGGANLELVIPNKASAEKGPDPDETIYKALKAAKRGDLLKFQVVKVNPKSQPVIQAVESYQPRSGEEKPSVYFFVKKATEKANGRDRSAVVVEKYLQEFVLLLPLRDGPKGQVPDPQMVAIIDGLNAGDAVEVEIGGTTVTAMRVYKALTK